VNEALRKKETGKKYKVVVVFYGEYKGENNELISGVFHGVILR
jgi:hypothetical protein